MTRLEVAVAADISDRTYADIERGTVNMKMDTFLRICKVLYITPDEALTESTMVYDKRKTEIFGRLDARHPRLAWAQLSKKGGRVPGGGRTGPLEFLLCI